MHTNKTYMQPNPHAYARTRTHRNLHLQPAPGRAPEPSGNLPEPCGTFANLPEHCGTCPCHLDRRRPEPIICH